MSKDGVITRFELVERYVAPEFAIQMGLDAGTMRRQAIEILLDNSRRQPKRWDTPDHHAAQAVGHLVDMYLIAGNRQIVGGGQSGRPGADDAHGLAAGHRDRRQVVFAAQSVHDHALEIADGERTIGGDAAARRFARRIADPAAYRAKRVGRGDGLEGLFPFLFPDVADIGRRVGSDRTSHLTGRGNEMTVARVVLILRWRLGERDFDQCRRTLISACLAHGLGVVAALLVR